MQKKNKAKRGHWIWVCLIPAALLVWWPLWFLCTGALMPEEELELTVGPALGAAQWLRCLAYSADLAHFGTFADALVGYTAVFCDVLEQYGAIRHSSGRPVIGRRTGCVGHQQTAFPRPRGGSRFVYRFNAIAFPGHNGSQLSGSTSIRSIGYPLGCHFARYLLNFSGFSLWSAALTQYRGSIGVRSYRRS